MTSNIVVQEVLRLPFSTAESEAGPIVEHKNGQLSIRYDAENENGMVWISLRFPKTVGVRFTADAACDAWMLDAYSRVAEVVQSDWLNDLRARAAHRGIKLPAEVRHLVVYFDHVGCWEVLADRVELES